MADKQQDVPQLNPQVQNLMNTYANSYGLLALEKSAIEAEYRAFRTHAEQEIQSLRAQLGAKVKRETEPEAVNA